MTICRKCCRVWHNFQPRRKKYIELLERKASIQEYREGLSQEEPWIDPAGAWSDLPDDMFEELDKIRHSSPPTPPIELP